MWFESDSKPHTNVARNRFAQIGFHVVHFRSDYLNMIWFQSDLHKIQIWADSPRMHCGELYEQFVQDGGWDYFEFLDFISPLNILLKMVKSIFSFLNMCVFYAFVAQLLHISSSVCVMHSRAERFIRIKSKSLYGFVQLWNYEGCSLIT